MAKLLGIDFRKGDTFESASRGFATVNGATRFSSMDKGHSFSFDGSTHLGSWDLGPMPPDGAIVVWFNGKSLLRTGDANRNLFATDDNGTNDGFRLETGLSTNTLNLYIGNGISSGAVLVTNAFVFNREYCLILTWQGTTLYRYFNEDGKTLEKNFTVSIANYPDTFPEFVLGRGFNTTRYWKGNVYKIEVHDTAIGDEGAALEYKKFQESFPYTETNRPSRTVLKPTDLSLRNGLVAAYNMRTVDGKVLDISGNGWDGTVNGLPKTTELGLRVFRPNSGDGFSTSHSTAYTTWSFCAYFRFDLEDISTTSTLVGAGPIRAIYQSGTGNISFRDIGAAQAYFDSPFILGQFASYVFVSDGTDISLYINGFLNSTVTPANGTEIAFNNFITSDITNKRTTVGEFYDFQCYDRTLSTTDIRSYHDSFARHVSTSDSFADDPVGNTGFPGWLTGGGSFKTGKGTAPGTGDGLGYTYGYVECTATGIMSVQQKEAYGVFEFDFYKAADADQILVFFVNSNKLGIDLSNGYVVDLNPAESVRLLKNTIGAHPQYFQTANGYYSLQGWYGVKMARTFDGTLYCYIRGGGFGKGYVLVENINGSNPVTDNTVTTSNYFTVKMDAGDRIRNIRVSGLKSPEPNNILSSYFNLTM